MVFILEYWENFGKISIPKAVFIQHQKVPSTKTDIQNEKVTEQAEEFKSNKSPGPYGIYLRFLKEISVK